MIDFAQPIGVTISHLIAARGLIASPVQYD